MLSRNLLFLFSLIGRTFNDCNLLEITKKLSCAYSWYFFTWGKVSKKILNLLSRQDLVRLTLTQAKAALVGPRPHLASIVWASLAWPATTLTQARPTCPTMAGGQPQAKGIREKKIKNIKNIKILFMSALVVPCKPTDIYVSNIRPKLVERIELILCQKIYDKIDTKKVYD